MTVIRLTRPIVERRAAPAKVRIASLCAGRIPP